MLNFGCLLQLFDPLRQSERPAHHVLFFFKGTPDTSGMLVVLTVAVHSCPKLLTEV